MKNRGEQGLDKAARQPANELLKRQRAVAALEALRRQGPTVPTAEIVRLLRETRESPMD